MALLTTCRGREGTGPATPIPTDIALVSGDDQTGTVGQVLAQPLVAKVTSSTGAGIAGVTITWQLTAVGGALSAGSVPTDSQGRAAVSVMLGTASGLNNTIVTARAAGLNGSPVMFTASASAGPVSQLEAVSGSIQTDTVGQAAPESLVVMVGDQFDNPVSGAIVTWAVTAGGGTVSTTSVTTDLQGRAAVVWTLGPVVGLQRVTAAVGGLAGPPAEFVATALAAAAAQIVLVSGNDQSGVVGTSLADPYVVRVTDAFGNPVAGVVVNWGVSAGGGSIAPLGAFTNSSGLDSATRTLGTVAGVNLDTATATGTGLTGSPIAFAATANPGPVAQLGPVSGDSQSGTVGLTVAESLVVLARDQYDNPVPGALVGWSVTSGDGTLSASAPTDGQGRSSVSWTLGPMAGPQSAAATFGGAAGSPVAFAAAALAGPGSAVTFTQPPSNTAAGSVMTPAVAVAIVDAFGNIVSSAADPVGVALGTNPAGGTLSGTTPVGAVNGVATFADLSIDQVGTGYSLQASSGALTSVTSPAFNVTTIGVTVLAFTVQPVTTQAGTAIVPAVEVTAQDALDNTVISFTGDVTIAIGTNPGGATLSGTMTATAVAGVSTFSDLHIAKTGTGYSLTATSPPLGAAASTSFDVTVGPVSTSLSTLSALPDTIAPSAGASASTIIVTARDSFGNPIPSATVVLSATGSGNTVTPPAATTNASGVATGTLSATTVGSKIVSATVNGVAITQTDTVTVTPGVAAALVFTGQPTNTAAAATINAGSGGVVVTARDSFGNTAGSFSGNVTLAIAANPSTGTLSGTLSQAAVAGVATFANLSIDQNGTGYTLRATSGALISAPSAMFNITASGSVVVSAGNGQTGLVGFALNVAPAVLVRDAANAPVANAPVTFAVAGGGGGITGEDATTNSNGIATVGSWTVQIGTNTLTATVAGSGITGNPVTFTATGAQAAYDIDVRFLTPMSPSRQAAFTNAAARWASLIYGNVPNIPVSLPAGVCGPNSPALNETIDDIVIFATVDSIDGPDNILGQAGPCFIRTSGKLPLLGAMIFDSADVAQLELDGQLELVILHEMGHVLGYGTIWTDLGLLVGGGGSDPHLVGAQAIAAFDRSGGQGYVAGAKVPVEDCCGPGTQDAHWRELVFVNELMTGFLDAGANPLSVTSTASMGDLGYVVNYAASDSYIVVNPVAAHGARLRPPLALKHDILRVPLVEVDAAGRVVQVHPPR
jgi:hypothetical protein